MGRDRASAFLPGRACPGLHERRRLATGRDELADAIMPAAAKAATCGGQGRRRQGRKAWGRAQISRPGPPPRAGEHDGVRPGGAGEREPTSRAFVDFQNDVTAKDIRFAAREGMHSMRACQSASPPTDNGHRTRARPPHIHGPGDCRRNARQAAAPQVGLTTVPRALKHARTTFGAVRQPFRAGPPVQDHDLGARPFHAWRKPRRGVRGCARQVKARLGNIPACWARTCTNARARYNPRMPARARRGGQFDAPRVASTKTEVLAPMRPSSQPEGTPTALDKQGSRPLKNGIMLREDGFNYNGASGGWRMTAST